MPEDSIAIGSRIHVEEDPNSLRVDAPAQAETRRYEDHTLDDADDNYAIRKAIKEQFQGHACLIFRVLFGLVVFLALAVATLIVIYICSIGSEVDRIETVLSHLFTHSLALGAGVVGALFGGKKESS